jgi:hypothetical protein
MAMGWISMMRRGWPMSNSTSGEEGRFGARAPFSAKPTPARAGARLVFDPI